MNIRIIRTHGNRTRTQGKLYVGDEFVCMTLEGRLPKDGECWRNQLVEPGVYRGYITMTPLRYNGQTLYAEWPELKPVRMFPRFGIYAENEQGARCGAILVGMEAKNPFELDGSEEAARRLSRLCHKAVREDGARLMLTIEGDISAVEYEDINITDWQREQQAEEERLRMEKLKNDFFA